MDIENKISELYKNIKQIENDYLTMSSNQLFSNVKNFYKEFTKNNYELKKIKPVLSKKFKVIKDYKLSFNDYFNIYIVETNLLYQENPRRFFRSKISISGILIEYKDIELKIDPFFKSISIKTSNNSSLFSIELGHGSVVRKEFNLKNKKSISKIDYNLKTQRFLYLDFLSNNFFNLKVLNKVGKKIGIGFAEYNVKNFYDNHEINYVLLNLLNKTKTKIKTDLRYQASKNIQRNRMFFFIQLTSELLGVTKKELSNMKNLDYERLVKDKDSLDNFISLIELQYKI